MRCHHCGGEEYRKNGRYRGVQRYICKGCGRSFSDNGERFDKATKAQALDMYLNNVGIRKIARFTGASPAGVLKWIRKAGATLAERLRHAAKQMDKGMPDVIEMDEIYTFVQKNSAVPSYGLLIAGDKVALLRITSATKASIAPSPSIG
jgi:transposase-like protein